MLREYNSYEISALNQLSEYRNTFCDGADATKSKKNNQKHPEIELSKKIERFTELFCENNFADADYSIIQKDQYSFESLDAWIARMDIELILQCITYIIWTDKSNKGYFVKKINDNFLIKILGKLHTIIEEYNAGKRAGNASEEVANTDAEAAVIKKSGSAKGFLAFF